MAEQVLMPKLGATMEKGTILDWMKNEGDRVEKGEPILEIMTDKINLEVEATTSGILLKRLFDVDTEVAVLEPIAYIGEEGEEFGDLRNKRTEDLKEEIVPVVAGTVPSTGTEIETDFNVINKPRKTPAANKLAKDNGINLRQIKGTGPNNRIHAKDVELFINSKQRVSPLASKLANDQNIDLANIKGTGANGKIVTKDIVKNSPILQNQTIQYAGMRKVIGERMVQSVTTVPHVTLTSEVEMTAAIELRTKLLDKISKVTGYRLSYTEIFIKAVAQALKAHKMVNASLNGNTIELHSEVNIGLAVAVPNGLVVPVIRNADTLGLSALTEENKRIVKLARENKLSPENFAGGTFTISNLGMYAVDAFTPIINQPQSAILGIGRIREKVVSNNGSFAARQFVTLSLSFDHRVIDGAPAAEFLTELKNLLENPYELMV
ncbi:2-oxo acid dehydrogenase subunit E2 [Peribacillus cavernae]|uniref:Dihydrolipoamide acetyltransferase component of pyruvate dehydrogenase complex n=1 Tax=Peribacillus cavernae TaxID=1674310 RepID=A0A433HJU1_9BACI|nr:dihydrolipoamide acetyltransferase family protein [Peribacillus cavernae]MDQ0219143.1 pyruvate dehydrogenase E2 component (dihydrolipoamide acetyltransferase) [Peribacillus cavernae]RUQ28628.1 2-oxo acid dehydrogenase subunit E2 [Peribacillus cavernae]